MGRDFRYYGQRPGRNQALILKVDELNMAMGTTNKNFIDFKMLQFILYIPAGYVSILEMMVEMRLPKSDTLSTLKDEYYEDIKRGGISQKHFENEKGASALGGKTGDDKIMTGRNKDDKNYSDEEGREGEKKGADGKLVRGSKAGGEVDTGKWKHGKDTDIKKVDSKNIEESTKIDGKGKRKNKDNTIVGNKETRAKSFRDENVVQIRQESIYRSPKNVSDTSEKKSQQSQNVSGSSDVGSFTAKIKQRLVSSKRDNPLGDEYGNVRGDKSGNNKQYDADSAGGGGRDDRSRGGSGRKDEQSGDDRSHRDRGGGGGGVGGNSGYGGSGGGGRRDKDDDKERRRKSCDTGRRKKGAKDDKDEDDDEDDGYVDVGYAGKSKEALSTLSKHKRTGRPIDDEYDEDKMRKMREGTESFEAGGLWKCMGRSGDRESYEDIEGTLAADSRGNLRFVPTHDKKDKGIIVRDDTAEGKDADERIGRYRGRDGRDYGRDDERGVRIDDGRGGRGRYRDDEGRGGRGRDYDRDDEGRGSRGRDYDRDDEGSGGRGRDYDRDDEGRGSRGRDYDRDDEGRGGRGRDYARDDEGRGGRGRDYDRDDESRGGRGGDFDRDDEGRGGRGKDYDRDDESRGGKDRDHERDGEGRGGRGRDYDRDDEGRGSRGRDYDRADEGRGGRGRDYDRDDQSRGGRGKGSERDRDRDGDNVSRGSGRDGRGGRDRDERGGGGWDSDGDGRGSGGRDGRDRDERGGGGALDDARYGKDGSKDERDRTRSRDGEDDRDDEGRRFRGDDYDEKQRGEGARFEKDDDRDRKGGSRGKKASGEDDDRSLRSDRGGDIRGDNRDRRGDGKGGSEDDEKYSKGRRGDDESVSGKRGKEGKDRDAESVGSREPGRGGYDEDERGRQVDRDRDGGESGDEGDSRGGKRSTKGRDRDGDSEKGRGKRKGKGAEEERFGKSDEAGKGIEDKSAKEGKGGKDGKESDEDGISGGKGEKRGKVTGGDNEDAKLSGKVKDVYSGESDEEGGIDGKGRGKGKVGDTDADGSTGGKDRKDKGKGKVGDTDEDDSTGGKDGKGKGKGKTSDIDEDGGTGGKDRKDKGKGKLGDIDEIGGTGGKDGKGRSKGKDDLGEVDEEDGAGGRDGKLKGKGTKDKDKRRGLGEDSDDELDDGKKGKGKSEDVERDGKRGGKEGKEGDRGGDFERDGKRGGKVGKEGDRDFEDERRGKGDKDAESISSKRGKDAKGKDKDSLSGKGKGKGGEGYDDEDEDDREGRDGAGARAGKPGAAAGRGAADKGAAGGKGKGKESSLTSVATVASAGRGKGAAGKPGGAGREGSVTRVGSIEVVTQTQFHLLEKAVADLQKKAVSMPAPFISNTKLLKDISKGNMSLTDVIATLQLQARLQAAERAINRMADLIDQLAAAGALTPEALAKIADIRSEFGGIVKMPAALGAKLPAAQEAKLPSAVASKGGTSLKWKESSTEGGLSIGTSLKWKPSAEAGMSVGRRDFSVEGGMSMDTSMGRSFGRSFRSRTDCVSPDEMREALQALREEFMKKANKLSGYANLKANVAEATTKQVADKVVDVEALSDVVTASYNTVNDYTAVFQGFGAGIATQMGSYRQQLGLIQADLRQGLDDLDKSCNSAETRPILDAREDMNGLENQKNFTHHTQQVLTTKQEDLEGKVKDLMETVELLREIKVDKDEVEDALKDKADSNRIGGIVKHENFYNVYSAMKLRLEMCYDKFRAQERVWTKAAQDINAVISGKFNASEMEAIRAHLMQEMQQLQVKAKTAAKLLQDPKAAILARRLYKESTAAVKATMKASDTTEPPRQALRPRPAGAEDDVCGRIYREEVTAKPMFTTVEDDRRSHICKRWCGGSHTLVNDTITREFARPFPTGDTGAVRRYMGQGTDRKMYMMGYHPCECSVERIPGEAEDLCPHCTNCTCDQAPGGRPTIVTGQEARRVTVVHDTDLRLMRVETAGRGRGSHQQGSSRENKAPSKLPDIVVQGRFTVLDEEAGAAPARDATRRSTLAEERIREQFATVVSNAKDSM